MNRALIHLNATLAELPEAKDGTPLARQMAAVERYLLCAKARLVTVETASKREA